MSASRSRYVVCSPWDARPFDLDIFTWQDKPDGYFFNYWVRIFKEFEGCSSLSGLTFYLISNHILVDELPSYGDDVVAVIRSDEECLIPPYLNKVRYVFKTYGFEPWCRASLSERSPASALKCVRDWGLWSWRYLSYLSRTGFSPGQSDRKMVVPLGYARQTDLPGKAFESRRYLVGFLGSIENRAYPRFSPKRLVATPKVIARSRMANSLQKLAAWAPESISYGTTASFTESTTTGAGDRYTEIMADTKIALAPRGSSVETYRFFEAMRQGCVVICDRLPPHWFYVGCPALQIDDWSNIEAEVKALSADPERLADLHRRSLSWWDEKLSERAVAHVIAKCLEAPRGQGIITPGGRSSHPQPGATPGLR
jgi:hypothetical protein